MKKRFLPLMPLLMVLLLASGCEKESVSTNGEDSPVGFRTETFDLEMLQTIHDAFVAKLETLSGEEGPFSNENANGLIPQMNNLQRAIDNENEEKGNRILQQVILSHLQGLHDDGLFAGFENEYNDLVDIANGIINSCPCFSKADLDALDWRQPYSSLGYPTQLQFFHFGAGAIMRLIIIIPSDEQDGTFPEVVHQVALIPSSEGVYRGVFWANEAEVFDDEITEEQLHDCYDILYEKTRDLQVGDFTPR